MMTYLFKFMASSSSGIVFADFGFYMHRCVQTACAMGRLRARESVFVAAGGLNWKGFLVKIQAGISQQN